MKSGKFHPIDKYGDHKFVYPSPMGGILPIMHHNLSLKGLLLNKLQITNDGNLFQLTLFSVSNPTTAGPAKPGMVAAQLEIPIRMPAYFGAISR